MAAGAQEGKKFDEIIMAHKEIVDQLTKVFTQGKLFKELKLLELSPKSVQAIAEDMFIFMNNYHKRLVKEITGDT